MAGSFQDWLGRHVAYEKTTRRARIYMVSRQATTEDRQILRTAAEREFKVLERLDHPGVVRADVPTECEYGPVLFLRTDPEAQRLDHFLQAQGTSLSVDHRLDILRQLILLGLSPRLSNALDRLNIHTVGEVLRAKGGIATHEEVIEEIRNRVSSRCPEAALLPHHPELERLIQRLGLELKWNPIAANMAGRLFVSRDTLWRLERGDPTVALGPLATAAFVLQLHERLSNLAAPASDDLALSLDEYRSCREMNHFTAWKVIVRCELRLGWGQAAHVTEMEGLLKSNPIAAHKLTKSNASWSGSAMPEPDAISFFHPKTGRASIASRTAN